MRHSVFSSTSWANMLSPIIGLWNCMGKAKAFSASWDSL